MTIVVLEHNWNESTIFGFTLSALIWIFFTNWYLTVPAQLGNTKSGKYWTRVSKTVFHPISPIKIIPVLWIQLHNSSGDSLVSIFSNSALIFSDQSLIKVLISSFDNISKSVVSTHPNRRGRIYAVGTNFMQQITRLSVQLNSPIKKSEKGLRPGTTTDVKSLQWCITDVVGCMLVTNTFTIGQKSQFTQKSISYRFFCFINAFSYIIMKQDSNWNIYYSYKCR